MPSRAQSSGIVLTRADAAVVKGMLARGDRQHDIAAYFGVNGGRIAEIATGTKFTAVLPVPEVFLPPAGPYLSGRHTRDVLDALSSVRKALAAAESMIRRQTG